MDNTEQPIVAHAHGIIEEIGDPGIQVQTDGTLINGITLNTIDTNQILNYTTSIRGLARDDYNSLYATTTSWNNKTVIDTNEEFVDYIKKEILKIKNAPQIISSYSDQIRKELKEEVCDSLIRIIEEGMKKDKEE